jgi:methylmalonyl-CoA mutase cobalamin-binding subunit
VCIASEGHSSSRRTDVVLVGYEDQENLGLRSIAAYLAQNGIRTTIEPCQNVPREVILAHLLNQKPKIVGFSLIFQRMLPDFSSLVTYLRENGVDAHFTIGGHFPTFEYQLLLNTLPALDSVVRHEGEVTLHELYQHLEQPDTWAGIKGLAYRQDGWANNGMMSVSS